MPSPRDFNALNEVRLSIAALDSEIAALGREIELIRRRREQWRRTGGDAVELAALDRAEAQAVAAQAEKIGRRTIENERIAGLIDAIAIDRLSPDIMLSQLDASYPIVLLPVRIETRFEGSRLRLRIYPDQIHLHQHDAELTAGELEAAKTYWRKVWADAATAPDTWRELATASTPERAAFLVDQLRPRNLAVRGGAEEPDFPERTTVEFRSPVRAEARLLPSRWLVALFGPDDKEIYRRWIPVSVPERLPVSPFGDLLEAGASVPEGELPIDDAARWLIDFARAEQLGMAVTINENELTGRRFSDGISRLIVVGVDWTRTPEDASAGLIDHLCAHGYAGGFGLLRHGEPTNNTSSRSSSYQNVDRGRTDFFPPEPPDRVELTSDAARLASAFGSQQGARIARFPGAGGSYEATVHPVQTALWGAAFGFYFGHVLKPLLSESSIAEIRGHLQDHVRPAGPLSAIRVGRQPYGVLPVLSTPVKYLQLATLNHPFERKLARMLALIRLWVEGPILNGVRVDTLDQVPRMTATAGKPAEQVLSDILKMGPLATRAVVRPILGDNARNLTDKSLAQAAETHEMIVNLILGSLGLPWRFIDRPLIYGLVSPSKPRYALDPIPWVAADLNDAGAVRKAVNNVRDRIVGAANDPRHIKGLLAIDAESAETLFEGLLMLSGAFEYWQAGERVVRLPEYQTVVDGSLLSELVGIERPRAANANAIAVETPRQLLQVAVISQQVATPATSLASFINREVTAAVVASPFVETRAFHDALDALTNRPAVEVDHAFRGLLDLGSHRLDAWITSLATRRLQALRAAKPVGIHIGGYGFVHDLKPDVTPDSEGYIHVPSPTHAATAAVLRAGHIANRADHLDAFAIRLTSERVRNALHLSEGMAEGQRMSALLGYRFERWLIDGRLQAKYIQAFRKLAPHLTDLTPTVGPQEAIAARDVVDGQRLAELWRERRDAVFNDLAAFMQPPNVALEDRNALTVQLDRLVDLFDSFLDLWTCESVHQIVRGNLDRAAAALAVVDRQERPPEALAIQTPRKCWGYAQRVLWMLPADADAAGWPEDLVSRTEPGANAIAARLIGSRRRFVLAAHAIDQQGAPLAGVQLVPISLDDLGLSPLALARLSEPTGRNHPTRLEERIAAAFASGASLPEGVGLALDAEPPQGAPAGAVGIAALLALLEAVRHALFDRRALTQRDFAPARDVIPEATTSAAVLARAATLERELTDAEAELKTAISAQPAPDRAAARAALVRASEIVPVASWARTPAGAAASDAELLEEAQAALSALQQVLARWRAVAPVIPKDEEGRPLTAEAELEAAVERIRVVFGPAFPVLTPFTISAELATEWQASLAEQDALWRNKSRLGVVEWLRKLSFVRPGVYALTSALDASAWTGHLAGGSDAMVAQLPHEPGRRWVALPFEGVPPVDVSLSAVLFGDSPTAGQLFVGVLLDEWTESIPELTASTSVSFQYDAPASRPPQTICLAVNAGTSGPEWTADALLSTVNEMFDLAQLRLLTPEQIAGHGAMLPTVFMPQNLSQELPSFDLLGKFSEIRDVITILGKS